MQINDKKQIVLNVLAKHARNLRGKQSQFIVSSENDISTSILSTIERGLKDPQLTTFIKLAQAYNIKPQNLMEMIMNDLPEDFTLIDI